MWIKVSKLNLKIQPRIMCMMSKSIDQVIPVIFFWNVKILKNFNLRIILYFNSKFWKKKLEFIVVTNNYNVIFNGMFAFTIL